MNVSNVIKLFLAISVDFANLGKSAIAVVFLEF
jgi:hypothetical protein